MIIIIDLEFCLSALVSERVPHVERKAVIKLRVGNIKSCVAGVLSCGEVMILPPRWANAKVICAGNLQSGKVIFCLLRLGANALDGKCI